MYSRQKLWEYDGVSEISRQHPESVDCGCGQGENGGEDSEADDTDPKHDDPVFVRVWIKDDLLVQVVVEVGRASQEGGVQAGHHGRTEMK